ncbi:MAG: oligosaccharide flippase family protein [Pseudomonadota bacterium]
MRSGGNAAISILGQATPQIASLLITIVAARYLSPSDYGVYALALVFAELNITITYTGYYYFIINSKSDDRSVLSTFFWIMLAIGTVFGTVLFVGADPLARLFRNEELVLLLACFALLQPFQSITGWASAALIRAQLMRRLFITVAITDLVALVIGIGLLLWWQSLLGLVVYRIVLVGLKVVAFCIVVPQSPKWMFDLSLAKQATRYAAGLYGARLLNFFSRFGTDLILAFLFSTAESGLYRFANRLANGAVDIVAQPLQRFAEKSFGHAARTNASLDTLVAQYLSANIFMMGGAAIAIAVLSHSVVAVLFQPAYLAAVPVVYALALLSAARSANLLIVPVFAARHRTSIAFWHDLVWTSVMLCTILFVAPFGFQTLAYAQAATMIFTSFGAIFVIAYFGKVAVNAAVINAAKVIVLLMAYVAATYFAYQAILGALGETALALGAGLFTAALLGLAATAVVVKLNVVDPRVFAD